MSILIRIFTGYIILFYSVCAYAEDRCLNLAEYLFALENYDEAITEYKRFIFFNPTSDSVSYAYYQIGLAYRNERRWAESLDALRGSVQTASNDSVKNEREISLAVTLIASGNYNAAEFRLLKLESFTRFPTLKRKAAFFRAIASLYSFEWENARNAFQVYSNDSLEGNSSETFSQVYSMLLKAQNLGYKSPALAKLLSTFLPGTGQIYAGDWRSGLNALAINILTGYFFFGNLIENNYRDAISSYFFLFRRYYQGNRYHAEEAATQYNQHLNQRIAESVFDALQNFE
ncbi:MAG: outer membrane protein assembly factor BamD [candidate division WOR-3 bacterium]|nr:outer membrane protein assembly factor BamD [candidate division WOR-3 bacterium]